MRANTRRDTRPELDVRRLLHASGLRYRVDYPLPFNRRRRADIAFPALRIAVFIDGCFWHGCPDHYRPATRNNSNYWRQKLTSNAERDQDTDRGLLAAGWDTLRFWEHQDPVKVADEIVSAVRRAQSAHH